ncbi:hypothetical protein BKA82DRAFT_4367627 [Pisolithus tinctorius]|nr:hypothetical protein BKA82DRAFT_4367627 [Pisolithus tinctorius]
MLKEEITQMNEDISLYGDSMKQAIQMSPAKISLLLSKWCSDEPFYLFPLPSYCLIEAMNKHLLRINSALLEYASWWTPLIHHDKFHPWDWSPGSASGDMVRAVLAHRLLQIVNKIIAMVFLAPLESAYPEQITFDLQSTQEDDDKDLNPKGKAESKAKAGDNEGDKDGGQEERQVGDDGDCDETLTTGDDDGGSGGDMSEACDGGEPEKADGNIMREQWMERRAHVKEQAAAHHQHLVKEAKTTIKYLNAVEKPPKITPKEFGIPTNCLSKLPSHAPKNIFHGQEFVVHHTYE